MTRARGALTAIWVIAGVAMVAGALCCGAAASFLGELLAVPPTEEPVTTLIPQTEIDRIDALRTTFSVLGQWILAAGILVAPVALAAHALHWDREQTPLRPTAALPDGPSAA